MSSESQAGKDRELPIEAIREMAEQAREAAEAARRLAEKEREKAAAELQEEEEGRQMAEFDRSEAEEIRSRSERSRLSAEYRRQMAEEARAYWPRTPGLSLRPPGPLRMRRGRRRSARQETYALRDAYTEQMEIIRELQATLASMEGSRKPDVRD